MTEHKTAIVTPSKLAIELKEVQNFDPAVGAYDFSNLGDAVRFADLMAKAGPMVPKIFRDKPAVCLAVTMRAMQWKFDPFALAAEVYQAKDDGPIGYQSKVFVGALQNMTGIQLRYRYDGETTFSKDAATSAKGNKTAEQTATGTRRCTAYAVINGEELAYTTIQIKDIKPKNSPLWHNDPDQQLAYYAGRAWVRRYRPAVMMGAYSADEVEEMTPIRDVTPKSSGFVATAAAARAKAEEERQEEEQKKAAETTIDGVASETVEGEADVSSEGEDGNASKAEPDTQETENAGDPHTLEYAEGATARTKEVALNDCPYEIGTEQWVNWAAGWNSHDAEEGGS